MDTDLTPTGAAIGKMDFQGNIIPATWYQAIQFENGKTDLAAVVILAEVVYWYRPSIIRDEATGEVIGYKRKFKADKLQRSYQSFADQFGLTKRQVRDACKRLSDLGLITLEFRTVETPGGAKLGNVLFLEPVVDKLAEITHPMTLERKTYDVRTSEVSRSNVRPVTPERQTYTETPTKKTTGNKGVAVVLTGEQEKGLAALLELGFQPENVARQYAATHDPDRVIGFCEYAEAEGLGPGWVRKALDAGGAAPTREEPEPAPAELPRQRQEPKTPEEQAAAEARREWQHVLDVVRLQMTKATFDAWLRGSEPLSWADGQAVIGVAHPFAVDWLENRLKPVIERAAAYVAGQPVTVTFETTEGRG